MSKPADSGIAAAGTPATRPLVVNADDLGLSKGINRAVERAHREGVVRSTSLLAVGAHFDDAVAMLGRNPELTVGAHLAVVGEDPPLLSAREIPTLVDASGRFPLSYRTVVARGIRGALDPADVRRELAAQLERITQAGITVSHVDTHQHTHLWPGVGAAVVSLATEHDIANVRLPRAHARSPLALGVNALTVALGLRLRRAGLRRLDYAGLDHAGHMNRERVIEAIGTLGRRRSFAGAEINVHPGYVDEDSARFDWGFEWERELDGVCDESVAAAARGAGFEITSFGRIGAEHAQ